MVGSSPRLYIPKSRRNQCSNTFAKRGHSADNATSSFRHKAPIRWIRHTMPESIPHSSTDSRLHQRKACNCATLLCMKELSTE